MRKVLSLTVLFLAISMAFTMAAFAQTTVVVNGNTFPDGNQQGWLFNRDTSTMTPYVFNNTYSSIGGGSLYVLPIQAPAANKFVGEYFLSEPMADIVSFSYDFRIGDGGNSSQANQFYMNVYANFAASDPNKFYDCRYNVVPSSGSTSAFTTVTFNTSSTYAVTQHGSSPSTCPASPAAMGPTATIRAFALNVGDSSLSDVGVSGHLDKAVLTMVSSGTTTFDFEYNVPPPTNKNQCKNNGYLIFNNPSYSNQGQCVSSTVPQ